MTPFEWDERKWAANLAKHGVDFELAKLIFEGPTLEGPDETIAATMVSGALAPSVRPKASCCSWSADGAAGDAV
ncbi:hypothetical protein RSO01_18180 [Reyranella soli]|uniref:BrnT family toxin n=1 Tax=Reyranella soli TaxID=1230389 RepID=A0A512N6N5_9HYPH|nr:hypothetical protein RSO01_18180 [Reyranella soli]